VEECGRPGQQNAGGGKMVLKGIFKMKKFDFKFSTNFEIIEPNTMRANKWLIFN
jgi:hypothetical protein